MPMLDPRLVAAAPRIHRRAQAAFDDLVCRVQTQGPPPNPAQAVTSLAAGIFAGSVDADQQQLVQALQRLTQVLAYAAYVAAFPAGGSDE